VSAGLSLAEFSLPICGPTALRADARPCPRRERAAPTSSARTSPERSAFSVDCAGTWITGGADAVWSGVSVRCSAGPILRFAPHR